MGEGGMLLLNSQVLREQLPKSVLFGQRAPKGRHRNRTVTIIDWDDTILPSHEIFTNGLENAMHRSGTVIPEFEAVLREIEESALRLLQRALSQGLVVVVTASESGWVEKSGAVFLPRVLAFFRKHSIRVVSARSRYERVCGPNEWKVRTFHDEIRQLFCEKKGVHVVVIGDGPFEYLAARSLKDTYSEMIVKMVKFMEGPTPKHLQNELSVLGSEIDAIFEHYESLEIFL
eukprot:CAMPEP_0113963400 /NCGR_PEP_ID=MMETSP0011_2-20120614/6489_1 /TAXON_ID=101924 /ORGANISM="Rhodosorus marinus" /LENGTH=230 /DNA_ID=CAMNT_0000975439 /DNA_START=39 /DNA_END=731 /DNA_ORIENTATION=+ /assembly_acc=CAM_ASM_000156